jgi:hypothetical protein
MTDDEVVSAIRALVAAGEHLDQLLGVPGARLEGGGVFFGGNRRLYRRGSPEHLEARAAGLVERLPPPTPTPPEAVEEAQVMVGHPLPGLLRRLYLEVGNGGFGPGYGILGVRGGHGDDYERTAIDLDRTWGTPEGFLAICYWGCAIYSLVDCTDSEARMWGCDPNPAPEGISPLFREPLTLAQWLGRWIEGRLEQPWLIEDPDTGTWRGATDEDFARLDAGEV